MAYTATLSGAGEVNLTGLADVPEYVIVHVITAGPQVRTPFDGSTDLVTHVGWLAWGAPVDLGFGTINYYRDPIWVNGRRWIWGLTVGQHLSVVMMRYYFSPGTQVYMLIGP